MAVNLVAPAVLHPVRGIRLGTAEAAIKKPGRHDLLVMALDEGSQVAGVFTRNAFAAAPVLLCRERLSRKLPIRALLINAGNANAATGTGGLEDAHATTGAVAQALGVPPESVLPFSTGVIGQRLPLARMRAAVPAAIRDLGEENWLDAARAIMTTDTMPKGATRRIATSQGEVTVTGIAKGVGMICPDMATMLAFVATDAKLSREAVRQCLEDAVERSFNCITIDGDTSTNDSCILVATGQVGMTEVTRVHDDYARIASAVTEVCLELAQSIVRDGEGATRFVTLQVNGARDVGEARQVAYAIAHSPLVKTALFAGDANWGRLVMAIGKAGVEGLDPRSISIALDDVPVLQQGEPHPDYREELGAAVLAKPEFAIRVHLGRGKAAVAIWTCDLSYDYVRINAEYRT